MSSDRQDRGNENLKVGIVGAGPSGMALASELDARDMPFDIFDCGIDFGGIWDQSRSESPIYDNTHFISSASMSGFPDMPMPESYPDFPRHHLILEYLRNYANVHKLHSRAHFGVEIVEMSKSSPGVWSLTSSDGGIFGPYTAIGLCTGHNWNPHIPTYPGYFGGDTIHSQRYRRPTEFEGKRVLIVGGGNSACDIACDLVGVAAFIGVSLRRPYYFLPKRILGLPLDQLVNPEYVASHLPEGWELPDFYEILPKLLENFNGNMVSYGLSKPEHPILAANATLNSQFCETIAHGDISLFGGISHYDGTQLVHFADGVEVEFDNIIYATGYNYSVPLISEWISHDSKGPELLLNMFSIHTPSVAVIGLFETAGAAFPIAAEQSHLAATVFAASTGGNGTGVMEILIDENQDAGREGFLSTHRHEISVQKDIYLTALQSAGERIGKFVESE